MSEKNFQNQNTDAGKRLVHRLSTMDLYSNFMHAAEGLKKYEIDTEKLQTAWNILDDLVLNKYKSEFVISVSGGMILFRARVIKPSDYSDETKGICISNDRLYGYNWDESKEPPTDYAGSGRTNHKGEPALYMASDELTACMEVRPRIREMVSVARFHVLEDIPIIDFSKLQYSQPLNLYDDEYNADSRWFLSRIRELFIRPVYENEKENYNASQMIVDHFRREYGIQGFAYKSFYAEGTNYTFFDDSMEKFEWEDSRVLNNYAAANFFISLDKLPEHKDLQGKIGDIDQETKSAMFQSMSNVMKRKIEQG